MSGDLNRWFKGVLYESSTRILLRLKARPACPFAAQFNRGAVITNIVENEVMPTLCKMLGVLLPQQGIQGRRLTALVSGKADDWKNRAFAERISTMVPTPKYRLIRDARKPRRDGGEHELYDLTRDPSETDSLASYPAHAAAFKEVAARLEDWPQDNPPGPIMAGVSPEPPAGAPTDLEESRRAKRKQRRGTPGAAQIQARPDRLNIIVAGE